MASKRSAADMEESCGQASSSTEDNHMILIIQREVKKALAAAMEEARKTARIEVIFVPKCEDPELVEIGQKLEGAEGKRIIQERGLLPISHFLKTALSAQLCCKGTFMHGFSTAVKARKIRESVEQKKKVFLSLTQQNWRIAYMQEDRALMDSVFEEMQEKLASIHERHSK